MNLTSGFYTPCSGNWVKQIKHICTEFPEIKFVRVCGPTTARINDLDAISNLVHMPLQHFVELLNKQKDF